MLNDEQMAVLGNRLVPLYQQLERDVIADIARRLVGTGRLTETAELMAQSLRDKGYSPLQIYKEVMRAINADSTLRKEIARNTLEAKRTIRREIRKLNREMQRISGEVMQEAADMAFRGDLSIWRGDALPIRGTAFERLIDAYSARAADQLLNLTKTTAFRTATGAAVKAQQMYTHQLNMALTKVTSGAYSYQQAVEEAVKELAKSGLRTVDYESGVSRQLDTAVRNAVLTASSQLSGEITMMNVRDTGVNHVEVSAHWGAREGEGHANHAAWQGKVYCVEGTDGVYENLEAATGYPSDPAGLKGYNCRHEFYPFWVGISEPTEWEAEPPPVEVDGRTYTYYQATQEQRRREREIRALKREEAALREAGFDEKAKSVKSLIRTKTAEYKQFSEAVGIRAKTERLRVCEPLKDHAKSGIINAREMSNGLRSMPRALTADEIEYVKNEIRAINADESVFVFSGRKQTGYLDSRDQICVRGDVFPDESSPMARDQMSVRAVLAHEYYGHRAHRGTTLKPGAWNDEFRASYSAAINAPNLTDEDRQMLMRDAIDRAQEAGVSIRLNSEMRRILYGY